MGEDRGQGLTRPLFDRLAFQSTVVTPALFLAPMAGVTHSAFRRLLGDFGGHGAVFTEMVSASAFLKENADLSPFTKRRPIEGPVVIQFRMSDEDRVEAVIEKAAALAPLAIDLNLGCPAPKIQQQASGAALWRDFARLASVLRRIRSVYGGPLSVKVRLGDPTEDWRTPFLERLKLFEDAGVDVLTVHPRFSDEKLKRRARWELFPWIADQTEASLADAIYGFGEERASRPIARSILRRLSEGRLATTLDLAAAVHAVLPKEPAKRKGLSDPATRTFQAIRIAVNGELSRLEATIERAVMALKAGGRIGVISFHSLEDRIVKRTLRRLSGVHDGPGRTSPVPLPKVVRLLHPGGLVASDAEQAANPPSRSARLRLAERLSQHS